METVIEERRLISVSSDPSANSSDSKINAITDDSTTAESTSSSIFLQNHDDDYQLPAIATADSMIFSGAVARNSVEFLSLIAPPINYSAMNLCTMANNNGNGNDNMNNTLNQQQKKVEEAAAAAGCNSFFIDIKHSAQVHDEQEAAAAGGDGGCGGSHGHGQDLLLQLHRINSAKGWEWWALMAASSAALVVGLSSASLLGRLYFVSGGSRRWLYTWVESAGWPFLLPLLALCYARGGSAARRPFGGGGPAASGGSASWRRAAMIAAILVAMGALTALDNLLYSWGISYLPVSTNSLLCASQLVFNAIFSVLLVRQRMSAYTINAVFTITVATLLLAFATPDDGGGGAAAEDERRSSTSSHYAAGVASTVLASALFALLLPLTELIYARVVGRGSFARVVEVQVGIAAAASGVAAAGMWGSGDWSAMAEEAARFEAGGAAGYAATLAGSAVGWQMYVVGGAGIIFLASSLMSCVLMTAMIPLLPLLALLFFRDAFSALKGLAMLLSLWGFLSYLYGAYHHHHQQQQQQQQQKKKMKKQQAAAPPPDGRLRQPISKPPAAAAPASAAAP